MRLPSSSSSGQDRYLTDGRVPVQRGFHLPQFHSMAANLYHTVPAAKKGVVPNRFQGHQVAGPVHKLVVVLPERSPTRPTGSAAGPGSGCWG
jgi:hypothetical protein